MKNIPDRIRVPRHAISAWGRVRDKLRADLEENRLPGDEGPITDARIAAAMIALCEAVLKVGPGIITDPALHPVYEAPPDGFKPSEADTAERLARIEKALGLDTPDTEPEPLSPEEREAFWRRLEENPPPPGRVPILPEFDMVDEAKRRFPHIYGDKGD